MKSQSHVWLAMTLTMLPFSAIAATQDRAQEAQFFESMKAIQDADPELRHLEVLRMPSELLLESSDSATLVGFDSTSVHKIKISVGHKMVVGCEWILYYFDGTEPIEIRRNLGGSLETLLGSGRMVVQGLNAIAESEGSLQLVAELTVFETDIPVQHLWDPKKGRYRPLWRGLATGVLGWEK